MWVLYQTSFMAHIGFHNPLLLVAVVAVMLLGVFVYLFRVFWVLYFTMKGRKWLEGKARWFYVAKTGVRVENCCMRSPIPGVRSLRLDYIHKTLFS